MRSLTAADHHNAVPNTGRTAVICQSQGNGTKVRKADIGATRRECQAPALHDSFQNLVNFQQMHNKRSPAREPLWLKHGSHLARSTIMNLKIFLTVCSTDTSTGGSQNSSELPAVSS